MLGIQYFREQKGISQADLGEKLNVSRQSISRWESGVQEIPCSRIEQLASIFDVDKEYINKEISQKDECDIKKKKQTKEYEKRLNRKFSWWKDEKSTNGRTIGEIETKIETKGSECEKNSYQYLKNYLAEKWKVQGLEEVAIIPENITGLLYVLNQIFSDKSFFVKESQLDKFMNEIENYSEILRMAADEMVAIRDYIENISMLVFDESEDEEKETKNKELY